MGFYLLVRMHKGLTRWLSICLSQISLKKNWGPCIADDLGSWSIIKEPLLFQDSLRCCCESDPQQTLSEPPPQAGPWALTGPVKQAGHSGL